MLWNFNTFSTSVVLAAFYIIIRVSVGTLGCAPMYFPCSISVTKKLFHSSPESK